MKDSSAAGHIGQPAGLRRYLPATVLVLGLVLYWLAYAPGLSGQFLLDDAPNLNTLSEISSGQFSELLSFSLQGQAGPLRRPISLFTFALQHDSWPDDPAAFKRLNMLIHALNALLLWWLFHRILPLAGVNNSWIAPVAATLWLLWPVHVSSVLYVIQRMALLAGTCMFLGLALYVEARRLGLSSTSSWAASGLLALSLMCGLGLGVLCKENAVVFPLLVLVIEATLFSQLPRPPRAWRLSLWLPVAMVVGYVVFVNKPWHGYGKRDFDWVQRLLTEGRVLWLYVGQILLPSTSSLKFLYDSFPVSTGWFSPITTLPSWLAWLMIGGAAWTVRKRHGVAAFAILFFLASHVLESTILPLELVFEHRNYIGSIALALAATAWLAGMRRPRPLTRAALGSAYLLIIGLVTLNTSSLWGQPLLQKRLWVEQNPDSARAHMAFAHQLQLSGQADLSAAVLSAASEKFPEHMSFPVALLELRCFHHELPNASLDVAKSRLTGGSHSMLSAYIFLDRLTFAHSEGKCPSLAIDDIVALLHAARENPAFATRYADLHLMEGILYSAQGNLQAARAQLNRAIALDSRPRILIQAASWEMGNGALQEAARHIAALEQLRQTDPVDYFAVRDDLTKLRRRHARLSAQESGA